MNIYDFWWIYMYKINGSAKCFIVLLPLLLVAGISGLRMVKLSR